MELVEVESEKNGERKKKKNQEGYDQILERLVDERIFD